MAVTLLPKYISVICLVMVTTLIDDAQGNKPIVSVPTVLNGGVVAEDAPPKTTVATFTSSDDGGSFYCDAIGTTFGVGLGDTPGVHTVITNKKLDYEETKAYTVTITCTDDSTPPLSTSVDFNLTISDVNEAPTFLFPVNGDDKATIHTNSPLDQQHVTVTANDADAGDEGTLEYSFHGNQFPSLFSIDTTAGGKGNITINKAPKATEAQSYTVTIRATDKGTPPKFSDSVPLTITFTDHSNGQVSFNNLFTNLLLVLTINLLYFVF